MLRVLLAVDDTECSVRAARLAVELFGATPGGARFLALNVSRSPLPWLGADTRWEGVFPAVPHQQDRPDLPVLAADDEAIELVMPEPEPAADWVGASLETAAQVAGAAGVPSATTLSEVGDPVDAILDAAANHDVDLIVVGSHHKSLLERLVGRSVSSAVVRKAAVPVLVVP